MSAHYWSMLPQYGTHITKDLSTLLKGCRNLLLDYAWGIGMLGTILCFSHVTCQPLLKEDTNKLCFLFQVIHGLTSLELPSFHATWLTTYGFLVHFYFRGHHLSHLLINFLFFHTLLHSGTPFLLQSVVVPLCLHLNVTYPYFHTYNL